jgi:hypothetical protein
MATVTDKLVTADHLISTDKACLHSGARCHQGDCSTRPIVDNFYQCLLYRPDCSYAATFGTSYLCTSPQRPEYSI